MYTRSITPYKKSFFLFGPRGTGKSTWLRKQFPDAYTVNLLPAKEALRYQKDPSLFRAEVLALEKDLWIVVDEIQKVPALLDEIHHLIEEHGFRKFILTGSSARRLKHGSANLLAGRALLKSMHSLTAHETEYSVSLEQAMNYGMLPMSVTAEDDLEREAYLTAYVETYLNEEIKYEGLVRNIGSFANFLEVATLTAGQIINMSGLARDAGISRDTVRGYFSVFEDTLLGHWLPAYKPRAKIKEVSKPKFYWFDPGVLNAAAGAFLQPMPRDWQGVLLEHLIHHELKAFLDYNHLRGSLGYWRTASGSEVDFIYWYGDKSIAIEVKYSRDFRRSFLKGLKSLHEDFKPLRSFVVYGGEKALKVDGIDILPAPLFLRRLFAGEVIPQTM